MQSHLAGDAPRSYIEFKSKYEWMHGWECINENAWMNKRMNAWARVAGTLTFKTKLRLGKLTLHWHYKCSSLKHNNDTIRAAVSSITCHSLHSNLLTRCALQIWTLRAMRWNWEQSKLFKIHLRTRESGKNENIKKPSSTKRLTSEVTGYKVDWFTSIIGVIRIRSRLLELLRLLKLKGSFGSRTLTLINAVWLPSD